MADGFLKFSGQKPASIELGHFNGDSDPNIWVFEAERYFTFYGFSKDIWLSLPYLYFKGEALGWFNWLYRNDQFYDWKHFTEKLACHYKNQIGLSPITDLRLKMEEICSRMHRHLDNIQNALPPCSQKFADAQERLDVTASLDDKCEKEEVPATKNASDLDDGNWNPTDNSEVSPEMLEPPINVEQKYLEDVDNYLSLDRLEALLIPIETDVEDAFATNAKEGAVTGSEDGEHHLFDEIPQRNELVYLQSIFLHSQLDVYLSMLDGTKENFLVHAHRQKPQNVLTSRATKIRQHKYLECLKLSAMCESMTNGLPTCSWFDTGQHVSRPIIFVFSYHSSGDGSKATWEGAAHNWLLDVLASHILDMESGYSKVDQVFDAMSNGVCKVLNATSTSLMVLVLVETPKERRTVQQFHFKDGAYFLISFGGRESVIPGAYSTHALPMSATIGLIFTKEEMRVLDAEVFKDTVIIITRLEVIQVAEITQVRSSESTYFTRGVGKVEGTGRMLAEVSQFPYDPGVKLLALNHLINNIAADEASEFPNKVVSELPQYGNDQSRREGGQIFCTISYETPPPNESTSLLLSAFGVRSVHSRDTFLLREVVDPDKLMESITAVKYRRMVVVGGEYDDCEFLNELGLFAMDEETVKHFRINTRVFYSSFRWPCFIGCGHKVARALIGDPNFSWAVIFKEFVVKDLDKAEDKVFPFFTNMYLLVDDISTIDSIIGWNVRIALLEARMVVHSAHRHQPQDCKLVQNGNNVEMVITNSNVRLAPFFQKENLFLEKGSSNTLAPGSFPSYILPDLLKIATNMRRHVSRRSAKHICKGIIIERAKFYYASG